MLIWLKKVEHNKTQKNILWHIKMVKEIITFGGIEIDKHKSNCYKSPIFLEDVNIEKVLVSNKISSDEKNYKYFFVYLYDYKVTPLHKMLPRSSVYGKSFDGKTKWIYFLIENDELLEKCNTMRDKVSTGIKKNFTGIKKIFPTF